MQILQIIIQNARENPPFAIILGLLILFMSQLLLVQPFIYLVALIGGVEMTEMMDAFQGSLADLPHGRELFRFAQGGSQFFSWGIAGLLAAVMMGNPRKALSLDRSAPVGQWVLAAGLIILSLPLVQFVTFKADSFTLPESMTEWQATLIASEASYQETLLYVLGEGGAGALMANILAFAIAPAVCEEIFFRGFLQQQSARWLNGHKAVWLTALIFTFFHFQAFGFLSRMLLGAMLGYLLLYSRSLWPCIIGHFVFNLINIVAVYLAVQSDWLDKATVQQGPQIPWWLGLLSLVVTGLLFFLYLRLEKKEI